MYYQNWLLDGTRGYAIYKWLNQPDFSGAKGGHLYSLPAEHPPPSHCIWINAYPPLSLSFCIYAHFRLSPRSPWMHQAMDAVPSLSSIKMTTRPHWFKCLHPSLCAYTYGQLTLICLFVWSSLMSLWISFVFPFFSPLFLCPHFSIIIIILELQGWKGPLLLFSH